MDEAVLRALARWPQVPACYGWLALDRRGRWRMQGEPVTHAGLAAFISRNYACDAQGQWFCQNGPQKVFVSLAYTPWIVRCDADGCVTHTGLPFPADTAWLDDAGALLLSGMAGIGLVHDHDLLALSESIELPTAGASGQLSVAGSNLPLHPITAAEVPSRFGFRPSPEPG